MAVLSKARPLNLKLLFNFLKFVLKANQTYLNLQKAMANQCNHLLNTVSISLALLMISSCLGESILMVTVFVVMRSLITNLYFFLPKVTMMAGKSHKIHFLALAKGLISR